MTIKYVVINVTYMVKFQDRVLVPWVPSFISPVAELVTIRHDKSCRERLWGHLF